MNVETVPLASLTEDPQNVRVHSKRNMDAIRASLTRFGQQKPLVVTEGNVIAAGNGTYAAALSLGWEHIDIVRLPPEWDKDTVTAYAIADNRTSELGEWDYGVLIDALGNFESDLVQAAGWDADGLQFLLDPPKERGPKPADPNANVRDSYEDSFQNYQDSETRSVLFDFPLAEYERVVAQLERLRERYNVDTNAEAVKLMLESNLEEE